jgi:MOSC domain-containing protein YiiM
MNGTVESIWIASRAGEPMVGVPVARAVPGVGLEGDRYAAGLGHYSDDRRVSRDLTLIEAEVLEGLEREHGIALGAQEARRNVTTRGVRLNDLVGRRFLVGDVLCEGTCLCEPCQYLVDLTGKAVLRPLAHRGGLRADILTAGDVRIGDTLRPE